MLLQMASFPFLCLSNIPLNIHTTYSLSIHLLMGHVGCFHVLAQKPNNALDISVHVSFWVSAFHFFLDEYPEMDLLYHTLALLVKCLRNPLLSSIVAAPVYIFTSSVQASFCFLSLPTFVICCLFDDSHSDRHEMISHWLWFAFLWLVMLSISSCTS